jgi:hypothetical protein
MANELHRVKVAWRSPLEDHGDTTVVRVNLGDHLVEKNLGSPRPASTKIALRSGRGTSTSRSSRCRVRILATRRPASSTKINSRTLVAASCRRDTTPSRPQPGTHRTSTGLPLD